ncbi:actin interacting protein 3-domain-containing protein [Mycena floridula]|nr:actin interacting protein 3-domain-containing protein [Mycena floridula]
MSGLPANPASPSQQAATRRDTNSSSRGSSSKSNGHPAVESAVTRLLVSIKQLLEALTKWSLLKIDENDVSDVYVRLGNDFNAAVAAFSAFGIDMAELMNVPDDLRNVLEQCLAEDATSDNLAIYLPTVRQIITNLLQGLRGKQSIYRKIVSETKHKSESSGHERTESRSSRSDRSSKREASQRSQQSRPPPEEEERRGSLGRKSVQTNGKRRDPSERREPSEPSFVGGFSPNISRNPDLPFEREQSTPSTPPAPPPPPPPIESPPPEEPDSAIVMSPQVPASVKRFSLVDKPVPATNLPPNVIVEPSSPDIQQSRPSSPPIPSTPPVEAPAMASSLAALKKSDTLERRASKRFSTYNISKITGSTTRERSVRTGGQANRRSLAVSSALTPNELAVLTEVDDEPAVTGASPRRDNSRPRRTASRPASPEDETPPVPPLPSTTPEPPPEPVAPVLPADTVSTPVSSKMTVFLQLGREVKKVTMEPGLSFSSLRVLFVDKFSYNPGLENFPAIYIRDPSSGVQYELEDMDEVKDKCLLSLNIEPLDQIKQHIDAQISSLSQDLKELRVAVTSTNRQSMHIATSGPMAESTPVANRPSERQFQQIARRLSRFAGNTSNGSMMSNSFTQQQQLQPQTTGQSLQPQLTGGSMLSDYSTRVVTDLKTQFDEVQNLRRDLGIMRQLYTEFMKQTKDSLGNLRTQTQSVKQLASSNIGGARAFIDSGKNKLDVRSQNVLTEVEKLQDMVETIKDDVLKRHITPKTQFLKTTKKDIEACAGELESLKEHINTIKPMWKKTWEEELQNIVEEQQFLTHQEEFLNDLLEDHKAVVEVYGHVEQVIGIRGSTSGKITARRPNFRPPAPEENGGLTSVMLEIRGASVDPEKRMKAIEANQKNREKDLALRSDDLQDELADFVGQKKLRMTGGAEEVERVRQRRNDLTLKAMFTGGSGDVSLNSP